MEQTLTARSKTGLPTKGKIYFSAFNHKTQLPVTCRPGIDSTGRLYTGQGELGYFENLTESDKEKMAKLGVPIIDHNTAVIIENDGFIDLDNPIDAANWKWLQKHIYIALDKGKKNRDTVFYLVNAQKDASMYVDKTAKTDEARPAVRRLSMSDQARAAVSLGLLGVHTFSPDQLLEWLLKECNTRPEAVLAAINPGNKAKVNATIFFKDIEKYKVIERSKSGAYIFGGEKGISIGHNEEAVVGYLMDPANRQYIETMRAMLKEKGKDVAPQNDVNEPLITGAEPKVNESITQI